METCNSSKNERLDMQETDKCADAVTQKRKDLVAAAWVLFRWRIFLATPFLLYSLETLLSSSSVNFRSNSKCLNDTQRAGFLKLAVASSLVTSQSAIVFSTVIQFPSLAPGV